MTKSASGQTRFAWRDLLRFLADSFGKRFGRVVHELSVEHIEGLSRDRSAEPNRTSRIGIRHVVVDEDWHLHGSLDLGVYASAVGLLGRGTSPTGSLSGCRGENDFGKRRVTLGPPTSRLIVPFAASTESLTSSAPSLLMSNLQSRSFKGSFSKHSSEERMIVGRLAKS